MRPIRVSVQLLLVVLCGIATTNAVGPGVLPRPQQSSTFLSGVLNNVAALHFNGLRRRLQSVSRALSQQISNTSAQLEHVSNGSMPTKPQNRTHHSNTSLYLPERVGSNNTFRADFKFPANFSSSRGHSSVVATAKPYNHHLGLEERVYTPGTKHNEDGTMKRYSPALEKRLLEEKLRRKEEEGAAASAGACVVSRDPTTLLKWTLGKDKSKVLKISVENAALEELKALRGEVSVMSIVGPYRTGKSFLLNQILTDLVDPAFTSGNSSAHFVVGDTVLPETEEVSMVIIPACARKKGAKRADKVERHLVLLDSPGLFAPNRAAIFDAQLLAVLNLLSSVVVYNNRGIIDRSAMEKLSFAVDTATTMAYMNALNSNSSNMPVVGEGKGAERKQGPDPISRPYLAWAVQDFHLQLVEGTLDGGWIRKVLQDIDKSNNGTSYMETQFNSFFSGYEAYTFPFPVEMVKNLAKLSVLPRSQLSGGYLAAVTKLIHVIEMKASSKKVDGVIANGGLLAQLIEKWADSINVPIGSFMGNSAAALLDHILFKEVGRVVVKYEKAMSIIAIPWAEGDIMALHDKTLNVLLGGLPGRLRNAIEEAVKPRLERHVKDNQEYSVDAVGKIFAQFTGANNQTLTANFSHLSQEEPEEIEKRVVQILLLFQGEVRHGMLVRDDVAVTDNSAPGWSAARASLEEKLEFVRGRIYRRNGVKEGVRLLHLCSEFLKEGEAEKLVVANLSTTKFEEDFESFNLRCGDEARGKVKHFIFQNQTKARPLSPIVAAQVGAEVATQMEKFVAQAHLRRRAILDFIKCAAHAGLPLEVESLDACALAAVRLCRGPAGEALCTITEELQKISTTITGVNIATSEKVCLGEGAALVAAYSMRAEMWWMLDTASSWHSRALLSNLLEHEWQKGSCRGPASRSDARKALLRQSFDAIQTMSVMRSQLVDHALACVYVVCSVGLFLCVGRVCEPANLTDPHLESHRRRKQMWCSCIVSVVMLQALVVSIVVAIVAPFATWHLQLSRQVPALGITFDEPDNGGISLLHVAICNLLFIQLVLACSTCLRARQLRAKALNARYNV